jgi:molybdate transport system substrate-binding protein
MRFNRMTLMTVALVLSVLAVARAAHAAEVNVLCSVGLKAVMDALAPAFEKASKNKVVVKYDLAANLKKQIEGGAPFDLAVLTPAMVDDLIKAGKLVADSRTVIARSGLALAIRKGAKKPDVSTSDAFKRTLLDAKSIAYAKEGASGVYFAELVQRLGIADALKAKTTLTSSGDAVNEAVTHGTVELGVLPVSEILPVAGMEVGGVFPPDVQSYVVMVAGVGAKARESAAARELVKFLMAPAQLPVIKAKGMDRLAELRLLPETVIARTCYACSLGHTLYFR